jgi:hypothetical protein
VRAARVASGRAKPGFVPAKTRLIAPPDVASKQNNTGPWSELKPNCGPGYAAVGARVEDDGGVCGAGDVVLFWF